jgi:hypothetical protein
VRLVSIPQKFLASQVGTKKRIHLQVGVPIVECKKCHNHRQIELFKIATSKKRLVKSFARDVLFFTFREMSILSVSRLFCVSSDMIRSILKDYLEKNYPQRKISSISRNIAILVSSIINN